MRRLRVAGTVAGSLPCVLDDSATGAVPVGGGTAGAVSALVAEGATEARGRRARSSAILAWRRSSSSCACCAAVAATARSCAPVMMGLAHAGHWPNSDWSCSECAAKISSASRSTSASEAPARDNSVWKDKRRVSATVATANTTYQVEGH